MRYLRYGKPLTVLVAYQLYHLVAFFSFAFCASRPCPNPNPLHGLFGARPVDASIQVQVSQNGSAVNPKQFGNQVDVQTVAVFVEPRRDVGATCGCYRRWVTIRHAPDTPR